MITIRNFQLKAFGALCLLAVLSMPPKTEAIYSMAQTCQYIQKGYIGDPTNCQNWGYCSGGALIQSGTCNSGLLYDSASGSCNYADKVTCQTSIQNVCDNLSTSQYIADPNNCNAYCYCNNKQLQCFNCPQYQVFDASTTSCAWAADGVCSSNSICRLVENNQFVADPTICGNYILCENGAGVSRPCPSGTRFNPTTSTCDSNYECNSNLGVDTPISTPVPLTNPTVCKSYNAGSTGPQYFSDDTTCYGFYSCASATAAGLWGACPFATQFNPTLQECVTPYTFDCKYDRCGNIQENFMTVANSGCREYSICVNQVSTTTVSCANSNPNYPYFNEYFGACVQELPNEAICQNN